VDKPEEILAFALAKYPGRVEVVPLAELATDLARRNDKRPAYVTLTVPDEAVKQLKGPAESRDHWLLVHVPREVGERAESRIVLPGEVR
jgi:hypothetical protein